MKKVLFMLLLAVHIASAKAQTNEIYDKNIASLQVVAGQQWLSLPVVKLGGHSPNDRLYISFDDLTHSYHRYTYKIEHCEADWTVSSQLFPSDYIAGFQDGNTIEYGEESINTNTLYTHYTLCIPNEQCAIKMSGNYKLTVFDEDDGNRPMFTACFMVLEPIASISLEVTTNTDIDINKAHQQVSMQVNYGYATTDGLKWEHCRDLIFQAGNEYHKYEILDVAYPTMGIDSIVWDGSNYHVYPYPCEPRPNYLYDEDANGAFYIRNSDNIENDIASDYVFVHYTLKTPEKYDGNIYVNGAWTNDKFTPEFQMKYDELDKRYTTTVMQKQGYYSYQFILIGRDGTSRVVPSEGCFYQTENKYQALVYYRGRGERTDRLVGFQEVQFK